MRRHKLIAQTCAVHLPGSLECDEGCRDRLRSHDAPPLGLVFRMADGSRVGDGEPPTVGPESIEEMDQAVEDLENQDDGEHEDEGDAEIDDDAPPTAEELSAELTRLGFPEQDIAQAVRRMTNLGKLSPSGGEVA